MNNNRKNQQACLSEVELDAVIAIAGDRIRQNDSLEFNDDNFTKMVINRLPARPKRKYANSYFPDSVGLLFSSVLIYWLVEPATLWSQLVESIQASQLAFSPLLIIIPVAATSTIMSVLAWWIVEK